jgi:hypothetical protein
MRTRIKKYIRGDKTWFEIERKFLFWWKVEGGEEFDILGMGGWSAYEFPTIEEAQKFIHNHILPPQIEIIE